MREQTLDYLLALDSDRLLHNFRVNAKLRGRRPSRSATASLPPRMAWPYVGPFLSACSQMCASTSDDRLKAKAGAMVSQLSGQVRESK